MLLAHRAGRYLICARPTAAACRFSRGRIQRPPIVLLLTRWRAEVAQLVEQTIRNRQVAGSIPALGSN